MFEKQKRHFLLWIKVNSWTVLALHVIFYCFAFHSCNTQGNIGYKKYYLPAEPEIKRWVGDIEYDSALDDHDFRPCNISNIYQYHNLSLGAFYIGDKPIFKSEFYNSYKVPENSSECGYLRIRFVVNCNGKAGMFRLSGVDKEYKSYEFADEISGQIMEFIKNIKNWPPAKDKEKEIDYYAYLSFRIENGVINEIIP